MADQETISTPTLPVESSSSSPDEAVAGTSTSGPPPMDFRVFQELLRRLALNMNLQVEEVAEEEDPIVDILGPEGPSRVALPMNKTTQNNAKTLWQTPASIPPTAKGVERKYFVPTRGYEYLFTHPAPCSLVLDAVNVKEREGQQGPVPKLKDAKQLDLFGRKVCSTGVSRCRLLTSWQCSVGTILTLGLWSSDSKIFSQERLEQN